MLWLFCLLRQHESRKQIGLQKQCVRMDEIIRVNRISQCGLHGCGSDKNGCDLSSIQSYCYFTRAPHRQQAIAANGECLITSAQA